MSILHNHINFTVDSKQYILESIEQYEKGDLCGYIEFILSDVENCNQFYGLYRITDKINADIDNKLQSIDNGYSLPNAENVFVETEKLLQKLVATLNIDYKTIEKYQRNY